MATRIVYLTKIYQFSAAHYLNSPFLSADENKKIFGKCGNKAGHGHNYEVRVTVRGEVNPVSGMLMDLAELDEIVQKEVLTPLDRKSLNVELKNLSILTTEILTKEIWKRIHPHINQAELYRIEVDETRKNGFKYFGTESITNI